MRSRPRLVSLRLLLALLLVASVSVPAAAADHAEPLDAPSPHFNVNPEHNLVWGHEWPEGATLTIEVDNDVVADDVTVFTEPVGHWWPGDFDAGELDFDFQPGQTVTVTSDTDPPVVKSHTITALTVLEIDEAADTVAGSTDSPAGSIVEVHVHFDDGWRMRHAEVDSAGNWTADFSATVEDHGEGWGQPFDIVPGTHGNANERDDDGDSTFADWRAPNPNVEVDPAPGNWVAGWDWLPNAEVTISIEGDGGHVTTAPTDEWGHFHHGLDHEVFQIAAGHEVTVTDGTTVRTHTATGLRVTQVIPADADVEANTVKGWTDSPAGSIVEVRIHLPDGGRVRYVEVQTDGSWAADFDVAVGDSEGGRYDLVPGTHGAAYERDDEGNATHAGWYVPTTHFNVMPATGEMWGHHWTPGATVTVTVNGEQVATDPDVVTVVEHDSHWYRAGDIHLTIIDTTIVAGDEITVTDGTVITTHVVTALTITHVDADTSIVTGTAEPGSEGLVAVDHWESGRDIVADETTGEWVADFSQPVELGPHQPDHWKDPYDIVPGTWVEAWQVDEAGNSTGVASMAGFAVDDVLTTQPGMAATIDVLANDLLPEGDDTLEIIYFDEASSAGGAVECVSGGECTYTPPAGFVGDDTFTYEVEAQPSSRVDTATVHVSVRPDVASFTDVPTDHGFFTEIEWLALNEITTGYADGTFRPTAAVTRQATAAFLFRYAGEPEFTAPATPTFSDVAADHPFFTEIEWFADTGITTGFADGTFRPTAAVTRQATAAFFHRYDQLP